MKSADESAQPFAPSPVSWFIALLGAVLATGVGSVFVVGGLIDWTERNVTARTLWGVLAMAVSTFAPLFLAWLIVRREAFFKLPPGRRWLAAIGVPFLLIAIPIGLAVLGHFAEGPIVIP